MSGAADARPTHWATTMAGPAPTEAPSTGPARTLRTSNSQVELRRLSAGPSGEIRAGPSLLSDMPLPFDMGSVSASASPRAMEPPAAPTDEVEDKEVEDWYAKATTPPVPAS